ncbi:fibrobacter succinogenes major paralogous domain-containing protein [Maribellus sp. CM-23]|uniref:fibrobacter succinogenes major paralogous domain-containing protein n=1 Tax=Maribellus sp. CM-23 TaxID=2781026 RepID=UPI001F1CB464|nr:fibrobacter succinogenes major paralogous domain-containing protein [Maribellus sp. CM-23]MCE4565589.1 fibrobacter succinogenes major paralogous domain-containing protein [Maribellus sp. CM-23]
MRKLEQIWKVSIISMGLMLILVSSCEKDNNTTAPIIPTSEVFSLSSNAVTIRSSFSNYEDLELTNQGICWSLNPSPTIDNSIKVGDLIDSIMFCRIEGLTPNTKYYIRAFATNMTGTSYGNDISFTTNNTVTDIDGNLYNTVTIGTQTWLVENLKTTRYNDETDIPLMNDDSSWDTIGSSGYCWYDNNIANKDLYGALYNWPAVNSEKLCPAGWHVPTDAEWSTLADYLGGEYVAAEFLKAVESNWISPNTIANNYSGFCALPGGGASGVGSFFGKGIELVLWSSTIDYSFGDSAGWNIYWLIRENNTVQRNGFTSKGGSQNFLSIRCVKN